MFAVGDKIVYPMHGAGTVEKIEEKKILGEVKKYYTVKVSCADMLIMVPVDSSDSVGVRPIISEDRVEEVLGVLGAESTPMPANWNKRYRENVEQLKTGDILKVAAVVRNLVRSDRVRKLSTGEKKLLMNAKQILLSELTLAGKMDGGAASELLESTI